MPSRMFPWAVGALLLLTSAAPAQKLEFPLKYQKHPDLNSGYVPPGSALGQFASKCPPGEYTLPKFVGEHPLYSTLKLGDSELLIVLDLQQKDDSFPSRMFFDRNGNRDLTDDPVLDGDLSTLRDEFYSVAFADSCDVEFQRDGKKLPYCVRFSVRRNNLSRLVLSKPAKQPARQPAESVSFSARTYCSYTSTLELDGKKYHVVLGDSNCNGSFSDKALISGSVASGGRFYLRGDTFYLTDEEKITHLDRFSLGGRLLVGDDLFDVEIDTAAGKLILNPVSTTRLPLKLSHAPERLLVQAEEFKQSVMMFRPGPVARVPAGRYRLLNYQLFKEGKDGDLWRLGATATSDSPFVTLSEGNEAILPFGEPFAHFATVPGGARLLKAPTDAAMTLQRSIANNVRLSFVIEGSGKELVSDLALISGKPQSIELSQKKGHLPLEPSYTIVKRSGEKVASGSFKYG